MKTTVLKLTLALLAIALFMGVPSITHAASSTAPAPTLLPENCSLTLIHLNGLNPATITCAATTKHILGNAAPDTEFVECNQNSEAFIQVVSGNAYCLSGKGYLGFKAISNVDDVEDLTANHLWFLYYNGGPGIKSFLNLQRFDETFDPPVSVTQICIDC